MADKLVTQLYGIVQRVHSSMPSNMLGDRDVFPKLPGKSREFTDSQFIATCVSIAFINSTFGYSYFP